jgi:orotate phosphoribosyltransferase
MISQEEVLTIFRESGALLSGHFLLASGSHSGTYLEKFQVLQYPRHVERLCRELAERFRAERPSVVVGPTTGGVLLAYEVAKDLGVRAIFAEREGEGRVLRRGFRIDPGEPTLVVDDILSTGGSVRDVVELVRKSQGLLVGVGVLVDRSGAPQSFGARLEALASVSIELFSPDTCPLCAQGLPLAEPGGGSKAGGK